MHLSADQFYDIVNSIAQISSARPDEKRAAGRSRVLATVVIAHCDAGAAGAQQTVVLSDLSAGGISLRTDAEFPPGTRFLAELPGGPGKRPLVILCATRHCRQVAADAFYVGAEFISCGEGGIAEVAPRLLDAA